MNDDISYSGNIITLTDDEGKEYELEHLDTLEHNGVTYMAFIPADADLDEEEIDFIIMKQVEEENEDGEVEEVLITLDSDEEMEEVYEIFMEHLEDEDDCDDPDCEHHHHD